MYINEIIVTTIIIFVLSISFFGAMIAIRKINKIEHDTTAYEIMLRNVWIMVVVACSSFIVVSGVFFLLVVHSIFFE
ncbi:hypothetical protein GCM10017621_15430 [Maricaulis virginensis]|uniref:Uncharacterized protein n=2 Tax=Maricaulis virginensis TaxID=144022 RepID=A0A9W6IN01_9PROT|nr:hypothetical protein GCM10017621_15430 [Maricaulis virginensis]